MLRPTRPCRRRFVAAFIPVAIIFSLLFDVTAGAASHGSPSSQHDENAPRPSRTDATGTTTTPTSEVLPPQRKVAVVTLVTTSEYIAGAQVLAESLHRVNAAGDRILLWVSSDDDDRSDLTEGHIQDSLLKKSSTSSLHRSTSATNKNNQNNDDTNNDVGWDRAIQLTKKDGTFTSCQVSDEEKAEIYASPHLDGLMRYWGTCSKFAAWTLTDYDVVIYLDADSLALNNFDFIYDVFLGQQHEHDDNNDDTRKNVLFAAQGNTDCWEAPPYNVCENFYTALMALRPSEPVAKYLHDVAERKGVHLMYGELVLLNSIINNWFHLPRYTLVAQSEKARPTIGNDSSNGNIMDAVVDWSQVKVYDFAGPPSTKPWRNYWLQKKTGDKYAHEYLGRVTPGMEAYHIGMYPQWVWNEYYDAVLQRKDSYNHQASNEDEL
jgi:hypothetical protein